MKVAIVQTPGSNCDQDALYALRDALGLETEYVWHRADSLRGFDAALIPGGFTYGDYLRGGAIASRAPIVEEVTRFAKEGKPVLGICNGFQILTEAGLLPGVLVRNVDQRFLCKDVFLAAVNTSSIWTSGCDGPLRIPIAHNEGRFVADERTLDELLDTDCIAFRYCTSTGEVSPEAAPNGSTDNIAGILNREGNVLGMMPHPERAANPLLGSTDGLKILRAFTLSLAAAL
jgi:phosphoribosylformylglycinamidine synthase